MENIRILIVDDHPLMREALTTALMEESDLQVVGEASDGAEGVRLSAELQPDVILMDLLMPGMNGLEAIERITAANPQARILVLTSLENEEKIMAAIQAGALGYFPKTIPRIYLLDAVRKVADGIPYLPSGVAVKLFQGLRNLKQAPSGGESARLLTPRQEEILALMGEGSSDQEIGKMLHLTEATVRSHVHRIIQRLGVQNRVQAVAQANRKNKEG